MSPLSTCAPDTPDSYYDIIEDGNAIRFSPCGVVSYNVNDIKFGYCARCHCYIQPGEAVNVQETKGTKR